MAFVASVECKSEISPKRTALIEMKEVRSSMNPECGGHSIIFGKLLEAPGAVIPYESFRFAF